MNRAGNTSGGPDDVHRFVEALMKGLLGDAGQRQAAREDMMDWAIATARTDFVERVREHRRETSAHVGPFCQPGRYCLGPAFLAIAKACMERSGAVAVAVALLQVAVAAQDQADEFGSAAVNGAAELATLQAENTRLAAENQALRRPLGDPAPPVA